MPGLHPQSKMNIPIKEILSFNLIEVIAFSIIVVPTIYVMITGAPFVPTQMKQVDRMLKAAKLKPGMKIYDLGSGDGRLVYKAAKEYGATAIGYEYSPLVWIWAKFLELTFFRSSAENKFKNFWNADLSDADVIVCYLLPHSMKRMEEEIWPNLKKGALVVSHAFEFDQLATTITLPRNRKQKLGPVRIYEKGAPAKKVKNKKRKNQND